MADPIVLEENIIEENCECYTSCESIKFNDIVGAKTLKDGGYFGDLLSTVRIHIEDSKQKGELTEGAAGEVYSKAIEVAMGQAIKYELSHGKAQKDIALVVAQTEYQLHKMALEKDQFALETYIQKGKLSLERDMNAVQIKKITEEVLLVIAQVKKVEADIISSGYEDRQVEQNIIKSKHEVLAIDASIRKSEQDILYSIAQIRKIDSDIDLTYQKIKQSISDIQKNAASINQMACQCNNETTATLSKIELNAAQIEKLICDCENSTKLIETQANLYIAQTNGFQDNARQKLFETQVQSYAMVFEAAEIPPDQLPEFLKKTTLNSTFSDMSSRVFD